MTFSKTKVESLVLQAIEKQKHFWFDAWGKGRFEPDLEVWRIEVRAGKNELKEKYQVRTFPDFENGIGDVITNALEAIRYVDDKQIDQNISRQALHPLWIEAKRIASQNLIEFRSGLTPDQVHQISRAQAMEQYQNLYIGNAIGFGIAAGMTDEELRNHLATKIAAQTREVFEKDGKRIGKSIERTRKRLRFLRETDEFKKIP